MVLVTLATWTVRGGRAIPGISRAALGSVKRILRRFWLQIATGIAEKSLSDKEFCQKAAWNSGLALGLCPDRTGAPAGPASRSPRFAWIRRRTRRRNHPSRRRA